MSEGEIKITAHIDSRRPESCRFTLDRPVYPGGSAFFPSPEAAKGSPLAERLFAIEGVLSVRIAGDSVTVTKDGWEEWRPVASKIGEALRAHVRTGEPAVSPGFRSATLSDVELKNRIQAIFDAEINPAVAGHGGTVELLDVKDSKVYVRMGGGCQGCGMADVTLRQGIEASLRERFPQLDEILDTTDHASGANPFFTPSKK